jgi:hypothetical protein
MALDSKNHVIWKGLTQYSNAPEISDFVRDFPQSNYSVLGKFAKAKVNHLKGMINGTKVITINGVPQRPSEDDLGRWRKELEIWEDVQRRI